MNKGISGGQSKRVNIGIALVTNPRVLFLGAPAGAPAPAGPAVAVPVPLRPGRTFQVSDLMRAGQPLLYLQPSLPADEPTSGLDSYTANEVMTVVKSLAGHGITVCATIHSPTPYCFNLFDSLLLLLRGQVIYFGANGG